jgi:nitrite reductase/ring-hydroxylating ferredoxin subunit
MADTNTISLTDTGVRVDDLRDGAHRVITVNATPVMLYRHGDTIHAMDSRCPHMGYPLTKGTVEDGILRCHWHHWRFDLGSGGCFTAGGDDITTYDVVVDNAGHIHLGTTPRGAGLEARREHAWTRLEEGIRERRSFLRARALVQLRQLGVAPQEIAARATTIALTYSSGGFDAGLVVLTAVLNELKAQSCDDRATLLGLSHGLRHVANDTANRPAKRREAPLPEPYPAEERMHSWFLLFLEEREPVGAERCLRTYRAMGASRDDCLGWLLEAATRHVFLSTGHVLDFLNKARELTDHLHDQPDLVTEILVGMLRPIAQGFRHEEDLDWETLLPLLDMLDTPPDTAPTPTSQLLLGDDPRAMVAALTSAARNGTPVSELARVFAEAAVHRLARFPVANADDWDAVHHLVTHANGVLGLAEALSRQSDAVDRALVRAIVYGSLYGYLNRFLNLPRHHLPGDHSPVSPSQGVETDFTVLAEAMAQGRIDEAADLAARLAAATPLRRVQAAWRDAVWREDAGFHAMQALDAALALEERLEERFPGPFPTLAGLRFTTAQRDRRLVEWEADTALKIARGEQLVDPE